MTYAVYTGCPIVGWDTVFYTIPWWASLWAMQLHQADEGTDFLA